MERLFIFELLESLSPTFLGELVESWATAVETIVLVVVGLGITTVAVEQIEPVGKIVFGGAKEETDVRKPELGVL